VQFVAICDPQKARREAVKKLVDGHYGNSDCKLYLDIREFLAERTDIDAILSATGDRWHALAAIWAMRAGKDIYSENRLDIASRWIQPRYGRVYQTGTQRLSEANHVYAIELALSRSQSTAYAHIAPDAAERARAPPARTTKEEPIGTVLDRVRGGHNPDTRYAGGPLRLYTSCIGE
jgi:hypothetical protein